MADTTFAVVESIKAGIPDIAAHADHVHGDTIGTTNYGRIPNDGKVLLLMDAVAGDKITFTPVLDKFGRTETLDPTVAAGKFASFGPFLPEIWNQADGCIIFQLTAGNNTDIFLAVRVGTPT